MGYNMEKWIKKWGLIIGFLISVCTLASIFWGGFDQARNVIEDKLYGSPEIIVRSQGAELLGNHTKYTILLTAINRHNKPILLNYVTIRLRGYNETKLNDILQGFSLCQPAGSPWATAPEFPLCINISYFESPTRAELIQRLHYNNETKSYCIPEILLACNDSQDELACEELTPHSDLVIVSSIPLPHYDAINYKKRGLLDPHEQIDFSLVVNFYHPLNLSGKYPSFWSLGGQIEFEFEDPIVLNQYIIRYPKSGESFILDTQGKHDEANKAITKPSG